MRHLALAGLLILLGDKCLVAQDATPPPPQSARQALIEMFMGKGADDFTRHLPDDARRALIHKGDTPETSVALRIASIGREMSSESARMETFDTGGNILVSEQRDGHEKIEVGVERDTLVNDADEIELSVHIYKDGELQDLPVIPRLIFTLKQEQDIWRLTEVTVSAHVPLTDPDYLKGLRKQQDESNEKAVQSRLFIMAQAENNYAANHKDIGYACSLAQLFPPPEPGSEAVAYYVPGYANEESGGYRFTLTGCDGKPASKYGLMAVPVDPDSEMRAFCVDESGTIKFVPARKKSNCFSQGKVSEDYPPAPAPN